MSETPINIEQFNRGYAAGYRDGWAKHVAERDALSAQLTEVIRERDEARMWMPQAESPVATVTFSADQLAESRRRMETARQKYIDAGGELMDIDAIRAEVRGCEDILERALKAEASLAPLRAVVDAAKAFMLKWPDVETASFAAVQIATIHGFPYRGPNVGAELKALADALAALPADPSAPTPR